MSTKHQFAQGSEQGGHTGGHGHLGHIPPGGGSHMMKFFTLMSRFGHIEDNLSDYHTDRLVPVSNKVMIGALLALATAGVLWAVLPAEMSTLGLILVIATAVFLAVLIVGGLGVTLFIRHVRSQARRSVLGTIPWQGNEKVLDVACGTGMLLNACAGKLTSGKATGIDMWQQPISGSPSILMKNAQAEGVADKVEYRQMDARQLAFPDASFDVVVSSFALHHIGTGEADREQAVREMARVLAPGGTVTIIDVAPMIDTAEQVMRQAGLQSVRHEPKRFFHLVTGRKV